MLLMIYFAIGIVSALYVIVSHILAVWKYIKQLYTATKVKPTEIKTYFNIQFWAFFDCDPWFEVLLVSSLITFAAAILSFFAWPLSVLFLVNGSIKNARQRISRDS